MEHTGFSLGPSVESQDTTQATSFSGVPGPRAPQQPRLVHAGQVAARVVVPAGEVRRTPDGADPDRQLLAQTVGASTGAQGVSSNSEAEMATLVRLLQLARQNGSLQQALSASQGGGIGANRPPVLDNYGASRDVPDSALPSMDLTNIGMQHTFLQIEDAAQSQTPATSAVAIATL